MTDQQISDRLFYVGCALTPAVFATIVFLSFWK